MENFLARLAAAGWHPHAGQQAYLKSDARFRVLACGRRWGKTDAAAADLAGRITSRKSSKQIAIAPTLGQALVVFERVRWMLAVACIACLASVKPYPSIRIHLPNADQAVHILDARSGHQAKFLRGQGADHILMDEAAYMPESLITETSMPMLAATNGRMTLISTPFGKNHFYQYFQLGQRGENEFWSRAGASAENPLVDRGFLEMQEKLLTKRAFATEYLAEFLDSSATVFGFEAIQKCLSAPPVDRGAVSIGVDWARHRDYTAVAAVRGTKLQAEVLEVQTWNGMSWTEIISRAADFANSFNATCITSDNTGLGDPVTEFLRKQLHNTRLEPYAFTQQSKPTLINNLAWMIENGRLRLPSDAALLRELEAYSATISGAITRYAAASGHDDRVCALALACQGLPDGGTARISGKERRQ